MSVMEIIASLIREFPIGSFFLLLAVLTTIERVARHFFNRNRPVCECRCCDTEECEDEDCDDDECDHDAPIDVKVGPDKD